MLLRVTGAKKPSNATALRNYTFYFITFSTLTQTLLTPPCELLLQTVSLKKSLSICLRWNILTNVNVELAGLIEHTVYLVRKRYHVSTFVLNLYMHTQNNAGPSGRAV
jgi:hypothetical protein